MPQYCFTHKPSGETIERFFPIGDCPDAVVSEEKTYERDIAAEHRGFTPAHPRWPLPSEAAGVHPSQVPEVSEQLRGLGVPTDFTPDGRVIFRDRAHRARVLKAWGMYDKDGGYGDG